MHTDSVTGTSYLLRLESPTYADGSHFVVHNTTVSATAVVVESGTRCVSSGGVAVEAGRSRSGVPQEVRRVVPVTTWLPKPHPPGACVCSCHWSCCTMRVREDVGGAGTLLME